MRLAALTLAAALAIPALAFAAEGMFTYYPANDVARRLTDRGLTFVFDRGLLGAVRLTQVMATEAPAASDLEPASDRDLGVRIESLVGRESDARDLYAIKDTAQGPAMIRAFCPGSTKGWLAFGPVKPRRDVRVHALGDDPATGKARLCATMEFRFRGEWKMPGKEGPSLYNQIPDTF
jgi:hypothetical protein